MPLEGGLRDRMLIESLGNHIETHLTSLGWFAAGREHSPISITNGFPTDTDDVQLNTIAFSVENARGEDTEMGTNAEVHETAFFVDMFMEDDSVGWHLSGDIYFYLKKNRVLDVHDYATVGDPVDFQVEISDVDRRKPPRATNPWQRHWFTVSCIAEDYRSNT